MREVDRLTTARYEIPSLTLMENAGASVAEFIVERWPKFAQRRIVVLCGKGNNGGDGFVVARRLWESGVKAEVYLFAAPEEVQGDAATNCKRWQEMSGALHPVRNSGDLQLRRQKGSPRSSGLPTNSSVFRESHPPLS